MAMCNLWADENVKAYTRQAMLEDDTDEEALIDDDIDRRVYQADAAAIVDELDDDWDWWRYDDWDRPEYSEWWEVNENSSK